MPTPYYKKTAQILSIIILSIAHLHTKQSHTQAESHIINYQKNPSQSPPWLNKLKRLSQGSNEKFRILQIGDSHTAGDFFTQQLRTRLQIQWGNGGQGWIYPHKITGQRIANIQYEEGEGWQILTSRKDNATFPMGGIIARSQGIAFASLSTKQNNHDNNQITFSVRPILAEHPLNIIDGNGNTHSLTGNPENINWQYLSINQAPLPLSYQTHPNDIWEIGYINIENQQPGIIVSAMGINGAQWQHWEKWRAGWTRDLAETQADLIIIAYGTNEAFDPQIDLHHTYQQWQHYIELIQDTLPNAGILIIGAPESLKNRKGKCGTRPPALTNIQQQQQRLAKNKGLLYWSWQQAMGGNCSMKKWIQQGLGRNDGVHFSAQGYQTAADDLANQIIKLVQTHQE